MNFLNDNEGDDDDVDLKSLCTFMAGEMTCIDAMLDATNSLVRDRLQLSLPVPFPVAVKVFLRRRACGDVLTGSILLLYRCRQVYNAKESMPLFAPFISDDNLNFVNGEWLAAAAFGVICLSNMIRLMSANCR